MAALKWYLKITLVFLEPAVGLRIDAENILGLIYNDGSWHLKVLLVNLVFNALYNNQRHIVKAKQTYFGPFINI